MHRFFAAITAGLALVALTDDSVRAQAPAQAPPEAIAIGYIELKGDPRYDDKRAYARIPLSPGGRPFAGAEVALDESQVQLRAVRKNVTFERVEGDGAAGMIAAIEGLIAKGTLLFIVDAPGDAMVEIARATRGKGALIFNATASDERLRGRDCQPHVMHTIPGEAMLSDALVQFIVFKKWTNILMLVGPLPGDEALAASFERSARKFGARVVAKKSFVLSNDPRQRELNNVALMTSGTPDHDVVFVADSDGEFARYVPYQTNRPRPVIGATGLVPETWHWSFERHGAPQLNSRFEQRANRRMGDYDWGAWSAVKAIVQGIVRSRTGDPAKVQEFLKGDNVRLDGFKGTPMSFRPWNNQLRQPLLIATANAVIERAPIAGFLHQTNDLDTLGEDRPESTCRF